MNKQSIRPFRFTLMWLALCILAVAALLCATAAEVLPDTFLETKIIDGFSIGVSDHRGFTNATPEAWLSWTVLTTATNPVPVRLPTQPEYAYQVQLLDAAGNPVPRTELGRKVGSKFTDFAPASSVIDRSRAVLARTTRKEEQAWQLALFRPADLFAVEKPGNYTLRIRFQVLSFPGKPGHRAPKVIRFPPLDCPLVKEKKR